MSSADHRLNIVVTQVGLDQATAAFDSFGRTATGVVQSQDALAGSLGKTQGAAVKTGQEFTKTEKSIADTGKTSTTTSKSTTSLGDAFKSSALQITAFASGLVSTIGQFINYQKTGSQLEKLHATLNTRTISLQQVQSKLDAQYKAGTISAEKYAQESAKLEQKQIALGAQTEILTAKDQQHSLQLVTLAASVIPTVINGVSSLTSIYGSLKGTVDVATQSTDAGAESMDTLGTAADTATTTGLIPTTRQILTMIPGIDKLSKAIGLSKSEGLSGALAYNGAQLTEHNKFSTTFVNAFKKMGSAVVNFASNIKTDMGNATGVMDKVKAGFVSFFSQLGTGFSGLGSALKTAGGAIKAFASSILSAFMSNPILGVITAIGAAIIGLIFNVGGFRDRLNELGVTLGKMAPWAKPFLDALGWIGERFAQIGDWIMGTDHLASATTAAGQAARKAADDFDTHFQAIQKSFIISQDFAKFEGIVQNLKNVKSAIDTMKETTISFGVTTIENLGNATNAFELFNSGIVKGVPEVDAKVKELQATFEGMRLGTISLTEGKKLLGVQLAELDKLLVNNINTSGKQIAAEKESQLAMKGTSDTLTEAGKIMQSYNADIQANENQFKEFAVAYVQGNDKVIQATGLSKEEIIAYMEQFKKEFPNGAIVVKQFGEDVVVSLDTIRERFGATSKDITAFVDNISKSINPAIESMTNSFMNAQKAVFDYEQEQKLAIDVDRLAAAQISNNSIAFTQAIDAMVKKYPELRLSAEKVRDAVIKAEDEQTKAREKENQTVDKQVEKAKTLGEARQDEIKSSQALKASAEELIMSLGRQVEVQGMTGDGLKKLIDIQDDTANAYGIAADSVGLWWAELQKSTAVEDQERAALVKFAHEHKVTLPDAIINGSIKAMKDYIAEATGMADISEESAQRIAAAFDSISSKAQSGLSDLIDEDLLSGDFDAVIAKIEETGRSLDQLSVQSVVIKPLLDTVDFEDGINSLSEIMGEEINETDLKAKDGGDQIMNTFTSSLLDTFGAEVQPLINTIDSVWAQIKRDNPGKTGAELIDLFMAAMNKPSEMTKLTSGIAAAGAKGFESGGHLFKTAGEKAFYELIKAGDPVRAEAYAKGQEIGGNVPKGAAVGIKNESGTPAEEMRNMGLTMVGQLNLVLSNEVSVTLPGFVKLFGAQFVAMGETMANLATAAQTHISTIESLMANFATNMGTYTENINVKLVSTQDAFSNLSTNVATYASSMTTNIGNWLLTTSEGFQNYNIILLAVQKTFSDLSTNVDAYTQSMLTNIQEGWIDPTTVLYNDYILKILELQKTFSDLSTSIATYMKSMTTNTENWATDTEQAMTDVDASRKTTQEGLSNMSTSVASYMSSMSSHVSSFGSACETAFGKTQKSAEAATKAVQALQKAIDALKDKEVTITYRIVTVGSPPKGARFGGSSIGYARSGKSWIQDTPAKVGGMNVSEFSKPEMITVTPLSNPYDVKDRSINLGGGARSGGGSPIMVTGDLHVTVQTQSGETLAKQVKPYILSGFSGIT